MQLSVIVPVYNGGGYLAECLDSLTKQGFKKGEHEVLVINDGSTDNTESIIDEYCSKYDYFVKINKENGGVSSARNLGLDTAMGDYIAFIDGDDMFAENGYLPLLDICYKENLDAFYYGFSREESDVCKKQLLLTPIKYVIGESNISFTIWNIIYKRAIIEQNKLRFDLKLKYSEDVLFVQQFTCFRKRIAKTDVKLYFYRDNINSAISGVDCSKMSFTSIDGKGSLYALSQIRLAKLQEEHIRLHGQIEGYEVYEMTPNLCEYLTLAMQNKLCPKKVIRVLGDYGIRLSDIDIKQVHGGVKSNFIYKMFRHKLFYRLACFIYRIIK